MFLISSQTIVIIAIVAAVVAVLVVGAIFIYKKIIFPNNVKKQLFALIRKQEYFTALLANQCTQNVKKIENIANSNLLYSSKASEANSKLKELRIKYVAPSNNIARELKDLQVEKKYSLIKSKLPEAKEIIELSEVEVNKFNEELIALIKPQEEAKQLISNTRERYRRVKIREQELVDELAIAVHSFDKVFAKMDAMFASYDVAIDSANIDECRQLAPTLDAMSKELEKAVLVLPDICHAVLVDIPEKLKLVLRTYNQMEDEGYNLEGLNVKQFITRSEQELVTMKDDIVNFRIATLQDRINSIMSYCDELLKTFDNEKNIKDVFEKEVGEVYARVAALDKKFVKLTNTLPDIKKIYIVSDEKLEQLQELENSVTRVGAIKRALDTYIQPFSMQPFTQKANKMKELKEMEEKVSKEVDEFITYIDSLKSDMQNAYKSLLDYLNKAKKAENIINRINIEVFTNTYSESIKKVYYLIDEINKLLNILPIDVLAVNINVDELKKLDKEVLQKIDNEFNQFILAEDAIVFTNRYRGHLSTVDDILNQAENYFYASADFKKAYETSISAEKLISEQASKEKNKKK